MPAILFSSFYLIRPMSAIKNYFKNFINGVFLSAVQCSLSNLLAAISKINAMFFREMAKYFCNVRKAKLILPLL